MFDFNDQRYTHMPFVSPDAEGRPAQFCCIQNHGLWKLYRNLDGTWKRLRTGLPADATECSPTAEWRDGAWRLSFVAGGWKADRRFRLYRMDGFLATPLAQPFADAGYVRKDQVVYAGRRGPVFIVEPTRQRTLALHGVEFIYRLSYNPFRPNQLLISGQLAGGAIFTWAYLPGLKLLQQLVADGGPAYKCALYDGECYYAQQVAGFEERHIVRAAHLDYQELIPELFITEQVQERGAGAPDPEFE